ncbi:MAG: UDP-N-acetylmuramoyl-L-alanyl-D-glutamate--2,6-diaminopimelate ligase [Candidatus Uhrbacteria bacterium]|nr:UDP-N-acetylmuramoyl-L-alanyl-D-glutamate--2,6-diaminopimelate ligase [Candidatus Uhrbacteria bacterium]
MMHLLRKITPKKVIQLYHWVLALVSAVLYGMPSNDIFVIGVTGTNGKSSTTQFIANILTELGETVGYTSTAGFNIAGREIENRMKITMPGRFYLQKLLRQMVRTNCKYAVVETSSQGIDQYRHLGINYDIAVFTNLTPEHIEAHGGFDEYKKAKGKLFAHLTNRKKKKLNKKLVSKISVLNADDDNFKYFDGFNADSKLYFSWTGNKSDSRVVAKINSIDLSGATLLINGEKVKLKLVAKFQLQNILAAISTVVAMGFSLPEVLKAAEKIQPLPGRFELVDCGQPFSVIVDYAYEPVALSALYESAKLLKPKRVIGVHGSAGGGRDISRRYKIGRLAAQMEDVVIVTNEDPYDEDPRSIIEEVASGARDGGKLDGDDLFLVDDRQEAIELAISLAEKGDAVLLTGKGSEPVMAVARGKKITWSDHAAAKKALVKLGFK